jgi:hypothetical protein
MKWTRMTVAATTLLATTTLNAMYLSVDIKFVPLARITRNLREALTKSPNDTTSLLNLARAHAMAWSLRSDSVPAKVSNWNEFNRDSTPIEPKEVWFGYEYGIVPYTDVRLTKEQSRLRIAQAHLDTALSLYDRALVLAPSLATARLGRAWLLTRTPRRNLGVAELRAIARPNEEPVLDNDIGLRAEAASYLLSFLTSRRDSAEKSKLIKIIDVYDTRIRVVTPLAIPLANGLTAGDIENRTARVTFDADGTALRKQWSWINPNAAWLVHDPARTGRITSALQLFGSVTFWMFWSNGYDALCSLDDNADGELRGVELGGLALWHDRNQNGKSERGEVRTVQEHGVVSLSCAHQRDARHPDRIVYSPMGVRFKDGSTRPTFDLLLHESPRVVARERAERAIANAGR